MDIISYERHNKSPQHIFKLSLFFVLFLLLIMESFLIPKTAKAADESITVKSINYKNSTITLQMNSGDTEVYYSNSSKKSWDLIEGDINNRLITFDISWISLSSKYTITFKGNHSTGITTVTLPKQTSTFKATYSKAKGTISFKNYGTRTIEWKKKNSSTWNTVNENSLTQELSYLYSNGATVIFRLAPVNGTSNTDVGLRASNEVTITIPKKASAPNIKINGSKFLIAANKGLAYRTKEANGTVTDWTTISTTTNLLLKNIAAKAMYTLSSTQSEVTLQFRTNASSSSQVSNISTVVVPVQEGPPSADKYGISLAYTGSSTLKIQVKAASTTVPFEYVIVKQDDELNYLTCNWTPITTSTAVTITSTSAPKGSHIFIRKKSIEATETVDYALASVEYDITGSSGVVYTDVMKASSLTTLITTAGICRADNSSKYLTFALYSPIEATVSAIDFYDAYGNLKGSATSKSTVALNSNSTGASDKYLITTKITSTEKLDTVTKEKLFAKLTMSNSDTIMSTATTGVILYLYPNTIVNNLTDDVDYTNSFKRIYMSTESNDDSSFKFKLDLGTDKVIDTTAIGSYTTDLTAISSITFNGYTLMKDKDYSVVYGSYINSDNNTIPTATVTMNVAQFEKAAVAAKTSTSILDTATPLEITLNNGEVLNKDINITLIKTAKIDNTPIAWSIMEGSLKETTTSTKTDTDGNKTTVTEDVVTYTITLSLYANDYGVGISDVTWGGTSVLGSSKVTAGKATINLSNVKINKLSTDSTTTNNFVITLSNGYVINTGCKLTITNAN